MIFQISLVEETLFFCSCDPLCVLVVVMCLVHGGLERCPLAKEGGERLTGQIEVSKVECRDLQTETTCGGCYFIV